MPKNDVKLNFTQVIDTDKPIEPNNYSTIVKKFELKNSDDGTISINKDGKWPYFNCQLEITDGPHAGRILFTILTTNPEPMDNGNQKNFMLFKLLKCIGLVDDAGEVSLDPAEVINKEVVAKVAVSAPTDDNPNGRNEVKNFYTAD